MSIKVIPQNFTVHGGDSLRLVWDVVDDNDLPVDLTAATGIFAAARNKDSTTKVIDSVADATTVVIGPGATSPTINDRVTVTIPNTLVAPLRGAYYYECEITDSSGNIGTIGIGFIQFRQDLIT